MYRLNATVSIWGPPPELRTKSFGFRSQNKSKLSWKGFIQVFRVDRNTLEITKECLQSVGKGWGLFKGCSCHFDDYTCSQEERFCTG